MKEFKVELDPYIAHASLIYDKQKLKTLELIYRQYIEIAARYKLPIMINTPTRRASPDRIKKSEYSNHHVNKDIYTF